MKLLKKYSYFIIIVASIFLASAPLLKPGFFPIHDNEQIARLYDLEQALKTGHIPPRIAPNLGFGYGYPFFNFYPSFVYYVAFIFKLMQFSYIDSIKLMIGLGFILAAIFMYLLSKEFFGKKGGVISSVAYTFSPYHSVDVYVRGALPEFFSFVFLPLIFLAYLKLSKAWSLKYFFIAIISNSALILTHNLIAFMASLFISIWIIFLLFLSSRRKSFFIISVSTIILAFGITAYFWIPSFFEKQFTMINLLTSELASYKIHFVCIKQLFHSPWGYGASLPFCNDGLSFEVGKIQLFLTLIAFFMGIYFLKRKEEMAKIIFVFFFFFLISLFMTNIRSEFIWNLIQPMWFIQFPWRYLLFSAFFSSTLAGAIGLFPRRRFLLFLLVIILLIYTNIIYFQPQEYLTKVKDIDYVALEKIRWDASKIAAEYTPKGIAIKKTDLNTSVIDIEKKDIARKSFQIINGEIIATPVEEKPQYKKFNLNVLQKGQFRINTYSFPGWKIYLDGEEVQYSDLNKLKLITVDVPEGKYVLEAKFTDTLPRRIGNWISLLAIIILSVFILKALKNETY